MEKQIFRWISQHNYSGKIKKPQSLKFRFQCLPLDESSISFLPIYTQDGYDLHGGKQRKVKWTPVLIHLTSLFNPTIEFYFGDAGKCRSLSAAAEGRGKAAAARYIKFRNKGPYGHGMPVQIKIVRLQAQSVSRHRGCEKIISMHFWCLEWSTDAVFQLM